MLCTEATTSSSFPIRVTVTGALAPCSTAFSTRFDNACPRRPASHSPWSSPRASNRSSHSGCAAFTSSTISRPIASRLVWDRTMGIPSPRRHREKSSRSFTRSVILRPLFRILVAILRSRAVDSPLATKYSDPMTKAPSGVRRSWPSTARNNSRLSRALVRDRAIDSIKLRSIALFNSIRPFTSPREGVW
jgi:hypothetical protein